MFTKVAWPSGKAEVCKTFHGGSNPLATSLAAGLSPLPFLTVKIFAWVAELVDALVSNTNGSNTMPVRPRSQVHAQGFMLFCLEQGSAYSIC